MKRVSCVHCGRIVKVCSCPEGMVLRADRQNTILAALTFPLTDQCLLCICELKRMKFGCTDFASPGYVIDIQPWRLALMTHKPSSTYSTTLVRNYSRSRLATTSSYCSGTLADGILRWNCYVIETSNRYHAPALAYQMHML